MKGRLATFAMLLWLVPLAPALAQLKTEPGDWPAWRGPDRTGISKETGLLKAWPAEGPRLLWKASNLGAGYSSPAVSRGKLFVLGTTKDTKDEECLIAIDIKNGETLWSRPFGKMAGAYPGPRCSPTVDGDRIYAISSNGKLLCAEAANGKQVWIKDFRKDFSGKAGAWAYTESPLVDGDILVCTPGGEVAPIVALNKTTGEVIWKADIPNLPDLPGPRKRTYTTAAYSSAIVGEIQGVKQYVQFLSGGVVGVNAATGMLLWHYDRPASETANISTPIQYGDSIFAASAHGGGGGLANILKDGTKLEAREAFYLNQVQIDHGGMIRLGDYVYGTHSRALMCIDLKAGKIAWQDKSVGKSAIVYADGHLYVRSERGAIALVEANPERYIEKGQFAQPERSKQNAWAHPVIAGGRLYLRDQSVLLCYDVKQVGQ
ncbi:MAG TPA: PQQ-binding-like beta-propeller repeat protein [Gemmataceae bacterium]|nr:PQQ-binding-like beta-propeller repeat protein [Gemmataceae bacterium]